MTGAGLDNDLEIWNLTLYQPWNWANQPGDESPDDFLRSGVQAWK